MIAPATFPRPAAETTASSSARSRHQPPPARDPFFDNAKFLLVVLVVVGHNWAQMADQMRAVKAAYLFVYAFHMPAFILLSGYFSRGFTARPDQVRKLVSGVLIPYLLFETAYSALYSALHDKPFATTLTSPTYLCWFLIALFIWRLTAPVWRAVPWTVAVAVAVSLAAGTTQIENDLALPRVLEFLPWFVLGMHLEPAHFHLLRRPLVRHGAIAALLAAGVGAYWAAPRFRGDWLLMQSGYQQMGVSLTRYLEMRLVLFGVSAVLVAAFLALVPRRSVGFTALGAATMYPYLLHGLVVKTAAAYGMYDLAAWAGPVGMVVVTVLAAALTFGLSSQPVRRGLRWMVEPGVRRARRRPHADPVRTPT